MGLCLVGGVRVHQGSSLWAVTPFSTGMGWCPGHLFFHTRRALFGPGTPLVAPAGCTQLLCWCQCGRALVGAGDPSSLPSLPQTVQVRSDPWARRGLLLAPARSERLSSPDSCDSGFYPDCFCEAAGCSSALGSPGDTSRVVAQGQCPSRLALGFFVCHKGRWHGRCETLNPPGAAGTRARAVWGGVPACHPGVGTVSVSLLWIAGQGTL